MSSTRSNGSQQPLLWHWLMRSPLLNLIAPTVLFATGFPASSQAQIIPDRTLGTESSVVAPDVTIRGVLSDRIDGGAVRGINLFHSFQQFNVGAGRGAYFSNPAGVENILSRVTGGSRSDILGRLGVLGNANLFLINPNGIVFGPDASLDVAGSFTATTADAIALGEQGLFSATQPERSNLLAVAPGVLFAEQLAHQGTIRNTGNLTAGRDLTLAAGTLDLEGSLQSGANLTLQGWDTVRIRDSVTRPFVAAAGGQLVVQGDRTVDIFALNHSASGLFSGDNMIVRSNGMVVGDAYYAAGGRFRIERLDGSLGNWYSPYDPYILANGNVTFGTYTGASLHILAGGSVTIGTVTITGTGTLSNTVNPGNTVNPVLFPTLANVTLSDGTSLIIDGSAVPTLDIRAGIDWTQLGGPPGNGGIDVTGLTPANFSEPPSSANITIQNIENNFADSVVLLTNQFKPNRSLRGNITIGPDPTNAYGLVVLDARDDIRAIGNIDVSIPAGFVGNAGDIRLISERGNIDTRSTLLTSSTQAGDGGKIILTARQGSITPGDITSSTTFSGTAGDITIIGRSLSLSNANTITSDTSGTGDGGTITLQVQSLTLTEGAEILTRTFGSGQAGNIFVEPLDSTQPSTITISGYAPFTGLDADNIPDGGFSSGLFVSTENELSTPANPNPQVATGNAGIIFINGFTTVNLDNGGVLSARTKSRGNAGVDQFGDGSFVSIFANVENLNITGGGQILAPTYSTGAAGNILINATGTVRIQGRDENYTQRFNNLRDALLPPNPTPEQVIRATNTALTIIDPIAPNSGIFSTDLNIPFLDPNGVGQPGIILVRANTIQMSDTGLIDSTTSGLQNGGSIGLFTQNLSLTGGAEILSQTYGSGNAGGILVRPLDPTLRSSASITLSGFAPFTGLDVNGNPEGGFSSGLFVSTENPEDPITEEPITIRGAGGLISIETGTFWIADGAVVSARSRSGGTGGDINVDVDTLVITGGGQILAVAYKTGNAGNISVSAENQILISGIDPTFNDRFEQVQTATTFEQALFTIDPFTAASGIDADVAPNAVAKAGDVLITTPSLTMSDFGSLGASTYGQGDAGTVELRVDNAISMSTGSAINSFVGFIENGNFDVVGIGRAGDIKITAGSLSLDSGATLNTYTAGEGDSGVILIDVGGTVSLGSGTGIFSTVEENATGNALGISITARTLFMNGGANVQALTRGSGSAGAIIVTASDSVNLTGNSPEGFSTGLFTSTETNAQGIGGVIFITTNTLRLSDGAVLSARTRNDFNGGDILIQTSVLEATNGGQVLTTAFNSGNAGNIVIARNILNSNGEFDIVPANEVNLTGRDASFFQRQRQAAITEVRAGRRQGDIFDNVAPGASGLFANTELGSRARGGNIFVFANAVNIRRGATISVNTQSTEAEATAGNIGIEANTIRLDRNATIQATTRSGNGGDLFLNASEYLLLRRDSLISTEAGTAQAPGTGGNITINTPFIIAAPSRNNDITANAYFGAGGRIEVNATGVLGIRVRPLNPRTNDIDASSVFGPSGVIEFNALDGSFLENSLTEFPQNLIDPNSLLAHSCIVRREQEGGTFFITGSGGLPVRPGDLPLSAYPTGDVRAIEESGNQTGGDRPTSSHPALVEPQGVYRLANGQLILSRECE